MREKPEDDGHCFICGKENPYGLKVDFRKTEGGVEASFSGDKRFQGYKNIIHGGIIAALLDEASVKALLIRGLKAVTAEIKLRYKKPLPADHEVLIRAVIGPNRKNIYEIEAEMRDKGGELIALSKAKLVCSGEKNEI